MSFNKINNKNNKTLSNLLKELEPSENTKNFFKDSTQRTRKRKFSTMNNDDGRLDFDVDNMDSITSNKIDMSNLLNNNAAASSLHPTITTHADKALVMSYHVHKKPRQDQLPIIPIQQPTPSYIGCEDLFDKNNILDMSRYKDNCETEESSSNSDLSPSCDDINSDSINEEEEETSRSDSISTNSKEFDDFNENDGEGEDNTLARFIKDTESEETTEFSSSSSTSYPPTSIIKKKKKKKKLKNKLLKYQENHCFLCSWGNNVHDAIYAFHVNHLQKIYIESRPYSCDEEVANSMYLYYSKNIRNENSKENKHLPQMTPLSVLNHIRNKGKKHTLNASEHVIQSIRLWSMIIDNISAVSFNEDGTPNTKYISILEKSQKMIDSLYARDTNKMNFNDPQCNIDTKRGAIFKLEPLDEKKALVIKSNANIRKDIENGRGLNVI